MVGIDLTRARAGPTAVRQLADWGADVIKVEIPEAIEGGDVMGSARHGSDFQNLQRNKRSMTLNLKDAEAVEILKRMVKEADVVIENFLPGTLERLGLGFDALRADPARDVAAFAKMYGVRTAWHGPGDTSPVGHAANLHLDLWAPNFGIQEWCRFSELCYEIFPGLPEVRDGYMYPSDGPGLGIDINEELAAKYPCEDEVIGWTQTRLPDGSPARP